MAQVYVKKFLTKIDNKKNSKLLFFLKKIEIVKTIR